MTEKRKLQHIPEIQYDCVFPHGEIARNIRKKLFV